MHNVQPINDQLQVWDMIMAVKREDVTGKGADAIGPWGWQAANGKTDFEAQTQSQHTFYTTWSAWARYTTVG